MVDVIGRAKVIVEGDVDSASIDAAGGKIGSSLKKGAVIGVAALGTLAVAGVKAFQAFEEAEKQSAKLANVLGNMGEGANVEGVEKLADSLMRVTGIDDEVIKGGQSILATFSEVAESAGDIGGVFERATEAALDMSATGFGSVESASVMLGKALQDPVKGVTALGRAGVTFSEDQKAMIKSLVETGDAAAAQDLILKEVEKQVGGTAEATATESAKISAAWGEVQESVGAALAELTGGEVNSFSDALFELADAIEEVADSEGWEKVGEFLRDLNDDINDNTTFLGRNLDQQNDNLDSLFAFAEGVEETGTRIGKQLSDTKETWGDWADAVGGFIGDVIDKLKEYSKWHKEAEADVNVPDAPDISQPASTRAVGGPASGLTWVGERGPELLQLPPGSYVNSNINSEQIVAASGGGDTFNITHIGNSDGLVQKLNWNSRYRRVGVQQGVNA